MLGGTQIATILAVETGCRRQRRKTIAKPLYPTALLVNRDEKVWRAQLMNFAYQPIQLVRS